MFVYELLNNEDMNLIFVEWGNGAAFPYHMAVGNTRLVGELCSVLKKRIYRLSKLSLFLYTIQLQ